MHLDGKAEVAKLANAVRRNAVAARFRPRPGALLDQLNLRAAACEFARRSCSRWTGTGDDDAHAALMEPAGLDATGAQPSIDGRHGTDAQCSAYGQQPNE